MRCEDLINIFPQVSRLERGIKLVAWLGTIFAFSSTIILIVALTTGDPNQASKPVAEKKLLAVAASFSAVIIVYLVLFWQVALILLIGLYQEDVSKVKLWLELNICLFFFGVTATVLQFVPMSLAPEGAGSIATYNIVFGVTQLLFSLCMIWVVKNHYYNKTAGGFQRLRRVRC